MIEDIKAELRAELARRNLHIYCIAADVRLHPSLIGKALRGSGPLDPDLARRIRRAIEAATGTAESPNSR